jgi:cell division inhibitor SulA/protein ImuA
MTKSLEQLLQNNPLLWRGQRGGVSARERQPTGYAELDNLLPGGGWPANALVEVISPCWGVGEVRLWLPVMEHLAPKLTVWLAPPHQPYAPALVNAGIRLESLLSINTSSEEDMWWSMEKLLRAQACGLVLVWPRALPPGKLRRLQLAAEAGHTLGVLIHPRGSRASPAAIKLLLSPAAEGVSLQLLKARGAMGRRQITLTL